jgi:SAM-dependent methyltransferase
MYAPWRKRILLREISGEWLDLGPGDGWALEALPGGVGAEFDGEQIAKHSASADEGGELLGTFAHGTFDAVWCSHVLQFVPEPLLLVQEARRVLRPGGKLVVTVPLMRPRIPDPLDKQVRFFTPGSLKRLLRAGGFDPRVRRRLGTVTAVARRV